MITLWVALAWASERMDAADFAAFDVPAESAPLPESWWTTFGDPQLDAVMSDSGEGNQQVEQAFARLRQARAARDGACAPLLPRASFDITSTGQPLENVAFCVVGQPDFTNPPAGDWCWQGSARLNASWQLDVFGRATTGWLAAGYDAEAQEGDLDAQRLAVRSALANAYFDVITARRQLGIIEGQLANQIDLLQIVELRYEQGSSSSLDVLQQRSAASATESLLPPARLALQAANQRLAVLLGREPSATIPTADSLPDVGPAPAPGTPASLLLRRPDLRAAESRWTAGKTRVTGAKLALLPSVQAQAAAGWSYALTEDLSTLDVWSVGGTLSVPIFNGGSTIAGIRSAAAAKDQATHALNQAVLDAVSDVQNALARDAENQLRKDAINQSLGAARLAYAESRERYLAGVDPFLSVLTAWNSLQQAELNSLQAHRDVLGARLALIVSLGGTEGAPR